MSDRQSKNYDGATKELSSVDRQTRAKTNNVYATRNLGSKNASHGGTSAPIARSEPPMIFSNVYATRNLVPKNASHGGTSAPIAGSEPPKIFRKSVVYSSSTNDTDFKKVPAAYARDRISQKKRKIDELKPKRPVGRPRKVLGKDSADPGIAFQKIDEAEFNSIKACSLSKREQSLKEEPSEGFSAANAWKEFSRGSEGSDSEATASEEIEMVEIDEAEFRKLQQHSESRIGQSVEQASASKSVHGTHKHHSEPFSPGDHCTVPDVIVIDSSPSPDKRKKAGLACYRESKVKEIDEAELLKGKSRIASKIGSSTRQGYSAAKSRKSGEIVREPLLDNYRGFFSSADLARDSDKETDKSSSFEDKGNNDEDTDLEELGFKSIDESEFRKLTNSGSKIGSSTRQDGTATSGKKRNLGKKKGTVSSCSRRNEGYGAWKRNVRNEDSDSSLGCTSSCSGSKSSSDGIRASLPNDATSSYGATHEMNIGVASRTRSKMGSSKKPAKVGGYSLDLSDDSGFSSSFEGESDDCFEGTEELCSSVEARDEQNDLPMKVSATDCSKQEGSAVKHAPKIRRRERKFSSRKRQLSSDASNEESETRKTQKEKCDVEEQNEEINGCFFRDEKAEVGLKESCPKCTCSKQSNAENSSDEAKRVDGVHPKDQPEAGIRRRKEASSSHEDKDNNDNEKLGAANLEFHSDDRIETSHSSDEIKEPAGEIKEPTELSSDEIEEPSGEIKEPAGEIKEPTELSSDEIKEPTARNQVLSKGYDVCSMLADAVLGYGLKLPESMGRDKEAVQAPPSPTQNTLPMKFRFEDEVPKVVMKTEFEKEMDGLFDELDIGLQLDEVGPSVFTMIDHEHEDPPAEETRQARCARGEHELRIEDDQGLICLFCHHEELGPKDILPDWVDRTYQDSGRKRHSEAEEPLEFDELNLDSSINNAAAFGSGTVWSLKPAIWTSMFEHQREGFEFLWKNLAGSISLDEVTRMDSGGVGGCIISHAPGSGKTRLTINFIETYLRVFPNSMPVIIGPASMLLTWEEEFKKWDVGFPFLNLNNSESFSLDKKVAVGLPAGVNRRIPKVTRLVMICKWSMGRCVLGISYSLFEKLTGEKYVKPKAVHKKKVLDDQTEKMRKILLEKPGLVFLDEGHTPRNQRSNIWNALLKLKTQKRVILSGTPFQNNFSELFNTLQLVRPAIAGALANEKMFAEIKATRRKSHSQTPMISQVIDQAVDKLKISMAPFVHIHKGDILQRKVPGLRDCVILLKPSALQKTLIERLEGSSTFEFEHRVALISVHPYLLQYTDPTDEQKSGIDMAALEASKLNPNDGVKTKFILQLVRLSVILKEKVLIFSQFLQPLELIKEQLKEVFKWGDGKEVLQMKGRLEQKHRQVLINSFNDPKSESRVMLASTKCCSEGISLIGASRVVLLDVVWNPSVERQAICRAYRVGQEKFVYTYHLMTSGTTEADKYCRQAEKERLSELVFSSSSTEGNNQRQPALGIEDRVLEEMVGNDKLKEMFEKIINQPKDKDLIQTFGLTS